MKAMIIEGFFYTRHRHANVIITKHHSCIISLRFVFNSAKSDMYSTSYIYYNL